MSTNKKTEKANAAENEMQTEDFRNIPAASDKKNPPDIKKEDINPEQSFPDWYYFQCH